MKKGSTMSEEQKAKISKSRKGQPTWASTHKEEMSKLLSGINNPIYGTHRTDETKQKMSDAAKIERKERYADKQNRAILSDSVKIAMHRPDIRKKHLDALHHSKWLKVRTDKGQIELLHKWNALGFKFEPNYQVHTETDLFYIDGYDKEHNVVLEYDTKYHNRPPQRKRDLIRQQRIIDILKPRKFWRYSAVNKQCENVLGDK